MSNITVSNYESASSYIALKLYCKLSGISEPTLRLPPISSEGDPRKIITKTKYTLWKTIGDFLEPALNAPKEEISNIVVEIAKEEYNINKWKKKISDNYLFLTTDDIEDLLDKDKVNT